MRLDSRSQWYNLTGTHLAGLINPKGYGSGMVVVEEREEGGKESGSLIQSM